MKFTMIVTVILGAVSFGVSAHEAPKDKFIKDYVSHGELDQEVRATVAQREEELRLAEQAAIEKRRAEMRRESFFNRAGRER